MGKKALLPNSVQVSESTADAPSKCYNEMSKYAGPITKKNEVSKKNPKSKSADLLITIDRFLMCSQPFVSPPHWA